VKICPAADLPPGEVVSVTVAGRPLAVGNCGGRFFALDGICSHGQADLADGYLDGEELECPLHMGRFNVFTGAPAARPVTEPVRAYPVAEVDGELVVRIDDGAAG